jgi:hypothetical protein
MPRIFLAASLLLAAVFAGALVGRAHRPEPAPVHRKALFQKPGSMNRHRPCSSAPGGPVTLRIVNDIDHSIDIPHDYVTGPRPIC